jgi:hypothetical protein
VSSISIRHLDAPRLNATRPEATRLDAARLGSTRLDAARLGSTRLDAARLDARDGRESILSRLWSPIFTATLIYVAAVSLYDGYLVIRTGDLIRSMEQNPVGVLLIDCNGGDPSLFLTAKAAGTAIVLLVLEELNRRSQRLARPVTLCVALFQSGLLIFLETF